MDNVNKIRNKLNLGKSFDIIERHIYIGQKETYLYYIDGFIKDDVVISLILSGQTAMLVEGFKDIILIDLRTYPVREVGEPEKEKTLRGARDGFVETIVFNTAMIRRRIRDERLTFKMTTVGSSSKSDIVLAYMNGIADAKILKNIEEKLSSLKVNALTMGDKSLIEALQKKTLAKSVS